ncbi:MAG: HlyD family secretion protein [Nitrospirales bacterium]|nr:HlyD family secretion protein [Nitrospirales bacterium]
MRRITAIRGMILLALGGLLFFMGCGKVEKEPAQQQLPPGYVAAEGKVESLPGSAVELGSEIDGRIHEFPVEEGDQVKKGDIIAVIENRDVEARRREAEAGLAVAQARLKEVLAGSREEERERAAAALSAAVAEREMAEKEAERYKQLLADGLVSRSAREEKERAYKVAAARVKEGEETKRLLDRGARQETIRVYEDSVRQAEATVQYVKRIQEKTVVLSPISGKVIRKYLQKGEIINQYMQTALVAIADPDKIRINAEVDETDMGRVNRGDLVEVRADAYPGKVFRGEVTDILEYTGSREVRPNNPQKNLAMKVVQVKVGLKDNVSLKIGMTVDVRIMPTR